jgi:hypothetical protein
VSRTTSTRIRVADPFIVRSGDDMRKRFSKYRRSIRIACAGALLALLGVADATATLTAPALFLRSVDATTADAGTLVRLEGSFPFGDIVQEPYDLQVFVRKVGPEGRFLWFPIRGTPLRGETPAVAGGLDEGSVWAMMLWAVPSESGRLLHVSEGRIEVQLPRSFGAGPAEAQLFVLYRGTPIFSNSLRFDVPEESL